MGKIRTAFEVLSASGPSGLILETAKHLHPHSHHWYELLRSELRSGSPCPIGLRARLFRQGFLSSRQVLYNFEGGAWPGDFVSDFVQMAHTGGLNGSVGPCLEDKVAFSQLLAGAGFEDLHPSVLATLPRDQADPSHALRVLARLLDEHGVVVVKPVDGRGGRGVHILGQSAQGVTRYADDSPLTEAEVASLLDAPGDLMITSFSEQGGPTAAVFPHASNTLRILTIRPAGGEPFVACAVHRFGTRRSGGLDNFDRGGLTSMIDIERGTLSELRGWARPHEPLRSSTHPDTGVRVEGIQIAGWPQVRDRLLEVVRAFPDMRYVGWDVLLTGPGEFVIIEANNQSGVALYQIHRPMLQDERVAQFFAEVVPDASVLPARSGVRN